MKELIENAKSLKGNYKSIVEDIANEIIHNSETYGEALSKCNDIKWLTDWAELEDDIKFEIHKTISATRI